MDLETIEKKLRFSLLITAGVGLIAVAAYFGWFGLWLDKPLSKTTGTWGELGDFIGGLMNPIVAGCALYWLAMSVRLQKQELADTRHELTMASQAQREQARMALLGIQMNALSIQLSAMAAEYQFVRARMSYVVQRLDDYRGVGELLIFDVDAAKKVEAKKLTEDLEARMMFLHVEEAELFAELKHIRALAMAEQTESAAKPHAPA